jgi:hypothetical protein
MIFSKIRNIKNYNDGWPQRLKKTSGSGFNCMDKASTHYAIYLSRSHYRWLSRSNSIRSKSGLTLSEKRTIIKKVLYDLDP